MKRKLTYIIICFCLIFFCTLTSLCFYIPFYVSSRLIPQIARNNNIPGLTCDVRRIGLTGADLGGFQISSQGNTAVSVRSVQIDYSPGELCKKHIKKILLSGIEINFRIRHRKIVIPGSDLDKLFSQRGSQPEPTNKTPVSVGSVEIRNATIICEWQGKKFRLPAELDIVPQDREWKRLQCKLRCYPRGQEFVVTADMSNKKMESKLVADAVSLERFADFTNLVPGLVLSGDADLRVSADLELDPFKISSVSGYCEFRNNKTAYKNIRLGKNPFHIEVSKNQDKEWNVSMSSVSPALPVPVQLSSSDCALKIRQDSTECSGNFRIVMGKSGKNRRVTVTPKTPSLKSGGNLISNTAPLRPQGSSDRSDLVKVIRPLYSDWTFSAKFSDNGKWNVNAKTKQQKGKNKENQPQFHINNLNIVSNIPEFDISGKGDNSKFSVKYKVIVPGIKAAADSAKIQIPNLTVKGELGSGDSDPGFHLKGTAEFSGAEITDSKSKAKARGIRGIIPTAWPCEDSGLAGNFFVRSLELDDLKMGYLKVSVRQKESGFAFETDVSLGKFMPEIKGIRLNGDLNVKSNLLFSNTGVRTSLHAVLRQGTMLQEDRKFSASGIRLDLEMPDLPRIRSSPGQRLSFKNVCFGDFNIRDGETDFQIESDKSFFIEKSALKWCNGNVSFHALRIIPGAEDYDLVLFCDRLNLAMVLAQFGFGNAEGQGSINGRIPLRYKNGELIFNDAFLFSTPGVEGTIHMTGADVLSAGIPKNTPQYDQIDLAMEALKNFDYKWAKLKLSTEGEDLKLRMQFDGKPANPLPFVYKKEFGRFVRVGTNSKGSHFQGIRLDVNMGLPINKLF